MKKLMKNYCFSKKSVKVQCLRICVSSEEEFYRTVISGHLGPVPVLPHKWVFLKLKENWKLIQESFLKNTL